MGAYVQFKQVKKVYHMGEVSIEALRDATFEIEKGEICVIVGASGAGKTTLLNILGGMDTLTEGSVLLDGKEISKYDKKQLTEYRRYDIGFVFQFYNLVQNLTALEKDVYKRQLLPFIQLQSFHQIDQIFGRLRLRKIQSHIYIRYIMSLMLMNAKR